MEMESSRRPSFDRSREPGLKKPRLVEEPNRPFPRSVKSGSSRFRSNERERESDGAGGYQPQPVQQPYQELINQYKSALSELTFNSKPIITNLTIIAGENLHAAKAIASLVCDNILEVPSEQKLPSLYLLDSIVKNIGRDFIKYFAARLPEVFCNAYRQVEPAIHNGMRHLFGTWKGVFPLQALQFIEKELGFQTSANGSASGTSVSRSDSLSQRQSHGIHVNPKYLERQRLQQSSKPKATAGDLIGAVNLAEELERPERAPSFGTQRPFAESAVKLQRPHHAALGNSSFEKDIDAGYGDYEYGSGLSRPLGTGFGRASGRTTESKQWLGAGRGTVDPVSGQRNGYDAKLAIPSHGVARGNARTAVLRNASSRSSTDMSSSWKNSEEEEFTWDELTSKVADRAVVSGTRKEAWTPDGLENLESEKREASVDSPLTEQKEQPFGNRRSSPFQYQEPQSVDSSSPSSKAGLRSHIGQQSFPGLAGYAGQSHGPRGKPAVSQYSPSLASRDPRLSFLEKDIQAPSMRGPVPGQSDVGNCSQKFLDSLASPQQSLQLDSLKGLQSRIHGPLSQQLAAGSSGNDNSDQSLTVPLGSSDRVNSFAGDVPVQSSASSLLAALTKSGVLSRNADNSGDVGAALAEPGLRTSAKPPSSDPRHTSSVGFPDDTKRKIARPPLPNIQQPSSSPMSTSSQASNVAGPIPFSSLLSTLVSKGLISASKSESSVPKSGEVPKQALKQNPSASASAVRVLPVVSSSISNTSTDDKPEPADRSSETSPQSKKQEIESLIGFEFRPRVLRELNEAVVDGLFDNLPHRCESCGLRFRLQDRLARHLEWHKSKDSVSNNSNVASRRWYPHVLNWVVGKEGQAAGRNVASASQNSEETSEENTEMVPADESQCVCLLCGDLFDDFYSLERDEWMFREAVYMTIPPASSDRSSGSCEQSVNVHVKCRSHTSAHDLVLANDVKMEQKT